MSYVRVREALKDFGVKGASLDELQSKLEDLTTDELYQIIKQGFKVGGIEGYEVNGTKVYRNRLSNEKLYNHREWRLIK